MTAISKSGLFGRLKKHQLEESSREEPDYVHTVPHDGNKYVDTNEFIKDGRVRKQLKRLAAEELEHA